MKTVVGARVIALITCIIVLIYACKSEHTVSERIKADHLRAVRSGFMPMIQELNSNYLDGFVWTLVIGVIVTVSIILAVEFGIKYYINLKRQELRSITNED